MQQLTYKQLVFCHKYIETHSASQAYRDAYNPVTASKNTIRTDAYKLLRKPYVHHMIEQIQDKMADKLLINTDIQVRKLEQIYNAAYNEKEYPSAISAINSQSKHLGLIQDKPLTTVNIHMVEAEKAMRLVSPEKRAAMLEILEDSTT